MTRPPQEPDKLRAAARGTAHDLLLVLRWPLTVIALAVLVLLAYRWTVRGTETIVEGAGDAVRAVGEELASIGERFRSGTITHTFVSSIPDVSGGGAGKLELATIEIDELLTVSDERRILWDHVSLGETVSEIRVPVTYRYHLRLSDPWRLEVSGQTCVVQAPRILASQPPAIHTEGLTKRTDRGWLRFNAEQQLRELERSLTPTLSEYAADERHVDLVREEGRRTVAEFVRNWLLVEDHWRQDRFRSIVVFFDDEDSSAAERLRPTLELE